MTCGAQVGEIDAVLDSHLPDLIIVGLSRGQHRGRSDAEGARGQLINGKVLFSVLAEYACSSRRSADGERNSASRSTAAACYAFRRRGLRASIVAFLRLKRFSLHRWIAAEAIRAGSLQALVPTENRRARLSLHKAEGLNSYSPSNLEFCSAGLFDSGFGQPHLGALSKSSLAGR